MVVAKGVRTTAACRYSLIKFSVGLAVRLDCLHTPKPGWASRQEGLPAGYLMGQLPSLPSASYGAGGAANFSTVDTFNHQGDRADI